MTTAAPPERRSSVWFVSPTFDLLLLIGTPLLIWPLIKAAELAWSADLLAKLILLTATGHYFATFVRAYGDTLLFRRFSVRFVVAPIVLMVTCVGAMMNGWGAPLLLVTAIWALWHWLAQAFGFARIYDAKVGSFRPLTALLDRLLVVSWFLGAAVLLPDAAANFARLVVSAGVALPGAVFFEGLRTSVQFLVVAVTMAYIGNVIATLLRGEPVSWIKQLCHLTTIGFYWFAFGYAPNLFVAYVLYELFHDIQYFAITWLSCRSRVSRDGVTPWMRSMFRPGWRGVLLFLVVMLVLGGVDMQGREFMAEGTASGNILRGVVLALALLHYYYDGFIWKVREDALRGDLGMQGGLSLRKRATAQHVAAWGLFFVPLGVLAMGLPADDERDELAEARMLVAVAPDSVEAQSRLASLLLQQGEYERGRELFESALAGFPGHTQTRFNYGTLLDFLGEEAAARAAYEAVLAATDQEVDGRSLHGQAERNLGVLAAAAGDDAAAEAHFAAASSLGLPEPESRLVSLAQAVNLRDPARALRLLGAAGRLGDERPDFLDTRVRRGAMAAWRGNFDGAAGAFEEVLRQEPHNVAVLLLLAEVRRLQGRLGDVGPFVEDVLASVPDQPESLALQREIRGP